MSLDDLDFVRLENGYNIPAFDCGNSDLNDFLLTDALLYLRELIGVSYLYVDKKHNRTAAFFTLANDVIRLDHFPSKNQFNKLKKALPFPKRFIEDLPAVKIGRLGIDMQYQGLGLGREIIYTLFYSFLSGNKTGCRYVTVDAYNNPKTISFYQKCGFVFLTSADEIKDTRHMLFDLSTLIQ